MANRVHDNALNIAADALVASTVSIRVHSGAPGDEQTGNRIGTAEVDIAAAGFEIAGSTNVGEARTLAATPLGVLSSSAVTVRAYSAWRGNSPLWWADLDSPVAVGANESFTLNAGQVIAKARRPS